MKRKNDDSSARLRPILSVCGGVVGVDRGKILQDTGEAASKAAMYTEKTKTGDAL